MRSRRKPSVFIPVMIILTVLAGGYAFYHFNSELEYYKQSVEEADKFFASHTPQLFINSAVYAEPYLPEHIRENALYFYDVPEGFTMVSYSRAWDEEMLEQLYYELLLNEHGDEINALYEVIVYPHEEEEGLAAALYTRETTAVNFFINFPAFPPDFSIAFPQDIGRITLFGGDENTTIASMASSLSHEYGHHYTHYYMFGFGLDSVDLEKEGFESFDDVVANSEYARLREAGRFDLITQTMTGEEYFRNWHRTLTEVAAEDYVQLMGSPTTRQIVDFIDVQQAVQGSEQPHNISKARNAFPQGNMMIPLAGDVYGLNEYFYSFVDASPRVPVEENKNISLKISRSSREYTLTTGLRSFIHYSITWNTPYQNAVYTLVCYDPADYRGWGHAIKTVRPGQSASAVIGEYAIERGNQILSMDDGLASGKKVFFVVALLPDGTFYISDKLEHQF